MISELSSGILIPIISNRFMLMLENLPESSVFSRQITDIQIDFLNKKIICNLEIPKCTADFSKFLENFLKLKLVNLILIDPNDDTLLFGFINCKILKAISKFDYAATGTVKMDLEFKFDNFVGADDLTFKSIKVEPIISETM